MYYLVFFFFKQKTAYEMRISAWSSDVCSSDLQEPGYLSRFWVKPAWRRDKVPICARPGPRHRGGDASAGIGDGASPESFPRSVSCPASSPCSTAPPATRCSWRPSCTPSRSSRSEEHTSELQSLMSISYAVFCVRKKKLKRRNEIHQVIKLMLKQRIKQ